MISKIRDVELIVTDSEVEALILETTLIKKIKPKYNIDLKDDKTFPYIVVTNEPYPAFLPHGVSSATVQNISDRIPMSRTCTHR